MAEDSKHGGVRSKRNAIGGWKGEADNLLIYMVCLEIMTENFTTDNGKLHSTRQNFAWLTGLSLALEKKADTESII
jgi:hypothetical protein